MLDELATSERDPDAVIPPELEEAIRDTLVA